MKIFFTLALLIFLGGCSSHQVDPNFSSNAKPSWVDNPNQNGFNGSIGMANIHHKGVSYQRRLAISRALDELALQKGVLVSLKMNKEERVKNSKLSTNMETQSSYETNNAKLTAHIEDTWQDKSSKLFYVWLVLD